ncbi:M4 family peptidase [Duganella sp. BJB488]|uniref:M4 family metallopeptidase n=1 Tax=unclassified Duganella TaxID=2636909 RepID=UPI000E3512F6|nr:MULTISPECIES: M4 family metallopeptidase [unclassified Duganella]NVD72737.1 M4 family metallopeptidase [Duganella sp. BJB1802]RFP20338.1 M4 family peptidase [Duganella sp. BJB489]RFP21432.1 M4 family peptidase [Duganella sp. BJB488]RFP33647.1 M4 family peptidase [Duganella sp. BJB480]
MATQAHSCTCFIIPTTMLRKLADAATSQADRCLLLDQCETSAYLRGQRSISPVATGVAAVGEKRRTVYDANHKTTLPGKLMRTEGGVAVADAAVNQAYDGAGITYDFYREVLKRNSIDNKGLRIDSTVHYQNKFNNAFWNGQQMVYGDGDGKLFLGFTSALDVIAHELTHGVTQHAVPGGLIYENQSGALNESISDVFGSIIKQWKLKQNVEQADWLIGAGILAPGVGKALRSMADPGNKEITWSGDDQPKTMAGYVEGGDVHTNSGIPNHAFYAAAIALKGNSWDKAGPVWYKALGLLTPNASFADMAKATSQAAVLLYGADSPEQHAVQAAWKVVGVV